MGKRAILKQLEEAVRARGWEVRRETGSFLGGPCRLKGRSVVVLNRRSPVEIQVAILEEALRRAPL
ncbi:MAG: hypothetical protein N2561_08035 [Bacteroidetes bacterium]|nr:hypothetical protein [Rhodothermia bacterium]MCS7155444.1 hypothetical protein [Bacteroidota bacterium]MCX7907463.1 hypothetical protein [Bacteroidota bacterium]MDW8138457.1 hypothetical protein [Bacteroidota bacterium]MDW8284606.1 hypothetical protein [Bacteroidota bacterium]